MKQYTPGPWHTFKAASSVFVASKSGHVIASISGQNPYRKAHDSNARLMAAAPRLVEAAEAYLTQSQAIHGDDACDERTTEELRAAIYAARTTV